jgi:hypothetical protein
VTILSHEPGGHSVSAHVLRPTEPTYRSSEAGDRAPPASLHTCRRRCELESTVSPTNMTAWARIRSLGDEKPAIICTPRPKDVEGTPARTIASRATCDQNTTSRSCVALGTVRLLRRCCRGHFCDSRRHAPKNWEWQCYDPA